jgi:hypothetical protein
MRSSLPHSRRYGNPSRTAISMSGYWLDTKFPRSHDSAGALPNRQDRPPRQLRRHVVARRALPVLRARSTYSSTIPHPPLQAGGTTGERCAAALLLAMQGARVSLRGQGLRGAGVDSAVSDARSRLRPTTEKRPIIRAKAHSLYREETLSARIAIIAGE